MRSERPAATPAACRGFGDGKLLAEDENQAARVAVVP
jgi:hypothetical protein